MTHRSPYRTPREALPPKAMESPGGVPRDRRLLWSRVRPIALALLTALPLAAIPLALVPLAQAGFPSPTYPGCGDDPSLKNCPPDMLEADGTWRGITWSFVSFIPPENKGKVRAAEIPIGSGNWVDKAFQLTVGRYDVPIAVVDCGIRWYKDELTPKVLLNRAELPAPIGRDGLVCAKDDCNGDGYFTVADYTWDTRVDKTFGSDDADTQLEPSDLIEAFSDGQDNDGNGYVDDIGGWDFMWNDNNPKASNDFYHGSGVMTDAAATAGDLSSDLGYCPNCAIIPVRVSDSFMGEGNKIAEGVLYAVDRGAKVIAIAMGGVTNSQFLRDAFKYAHDHNVLIVNAIGDELSFEHLPPGVNDYAFPVHTIQYYPFTGGKTTRSFLGFHGCNNYGAHLSLVAATNDCATGSTAIISGIAGLIFSRGLDNGIQLSSDEVRAILIESADDIDVPESRADRTPYFPSWPGWDQFFGYGRVNARHAVDMARPDKVPPEVFIKSPTFYEVIDPREMPSIQINAHIAAPRSQSFTWTLEWAPGADVRDTEFTSLTTGNEVKARDGVVFTWPIASIPTSILDPKKPLEAISGADPLLEKLKKIHACAVTLRLTAVDESGNKAEQRKTFFVHQDPDQAAGFPKKIGPGESSPSLYDLNRDGKLDIVVGTSDGVVHALQGSGLELPGWPVTVGAMPGTDPASPSGHSTAKPYKNGVVPARQGILGTVFPTDLEHDGQAEVLVSTLDGWLYAFTSDGKVKKGFPVTRDDLEDGDSDPMHQYDPGMAAGPVAADLDGDGRLEIILPAMDQKVYVWQADGSRFPGFPVVLEDTSADNHNVGRIFSTPAVGDMDGDGEPEIVVGSNEYNEDYPFLTYVYALHAHGYGDPDGPFVRGWPVQELGLLSHVVNYMGDGITMTPVMFDLEGDGKLEVAIAAPGGCPTVLDARGRSLVTMSCDESGWGAGRDTDEAGALTYLANLTVADVNMDGKPDIIAGMSGLNYGISLGLSRWMPYQDHMVLVWDAQSGEALDAWPRVVEDICMFVKAGVADVDGDGMPEVLMSSGGYAVHAWDADGFEPQGWPKFTGGWVYSAIRAGDVDGDGTTEVVAVTREGELWVWKTDGAAGSAAREPGVAEADFGADVDGEEPGALAVEPDRGRPSPSFIPSPRPAIPSGRSARGDR